MMNKTLTEHQMLVNGYEEYKRELENKRKEDIKGKYRKSSDQVIENEIKALTKELPNYCKDTFYHNEALCMAKEIIYLTYELECRRQDKNMKAVEGESPSYKEILTEDD